MAASCDATRLRKNERTAQWKRENASAVAVYMKGYREKNGERIAATTTAYLSENREEVLLKGRQRAKRLRKGSSSLRETCRVRAAEWYQKNRERAARAGAAKRKRLMRVDPEFAAKRRIEGYLKRDKALVLRVRSRQGSLSKYISEGRFGVAWYAAAVGDAEAKGLSSYHADHIVAYDFLRFAGVEDLAILFHPANCQALSPTENLSKGNKACVEGLALVKRYRSDLVDLYLMWGQDYGWYGEDAA